MYTQYLRIYIYIDKYNFWYEELTPNNSPSKLSLLSFIIFFKFLIPLKIISYFYNSSYSHTFPGLCPMKGYFKTWLGKAQARLAGKIRNTWFHKRCASKIVVPWYAELTSTRCDPAGGGSWPSPPSAAPSLASPLLRTSSAPPLLPFPIPPPSLVLFIFLSSLSWIGFCSVLFLLMLISWFGLYQDMGIDY